MRTKQSRILRVHMTRIVLLALIACVLVQAPARGQAAEAGLTVGGLIAKLALLDDLMSNTLGSVKGDMHDLMFDARDKIRTTRMELEAAYKDKLDYTLASLDIATSQKLTELDGKANGWSKAMTDVVSNGGSVSRDVLVDARFTTATVLLGLRDTASSFSLQGSRLVSFAAVSTVRLVATVCCVILLAVIALIAAMIPKKLPYLIGAAALILFVTGAFTITRLPALLVGTKLEEDKSTVVAFMAPDHFVIGQTTKFFVVGQNFMSGDTRSKVLLDPLQFSPSVQTNYLITGDVVVPDSVKPGIVPIVLASPDGKTASPRPVKIEYPDERTVTELSVKFSGSKAALDRREASYTITALSVYGEDDGVVKEDILQPPAGYTLIDVRSGYRKTLGDDGQHTVEKRDNGVYYRLTAHHGGYFNRTRGMTHLDITLVYQKGISVPAEVVTSVPITTVVVPKGASVALADLTQIAHGDIQTVEAYTATFKVKQPDGTIASGAFTFRAHVDGTSPPVLGVVLDSRGDSIFVRN